ncbi:hypothetical protein PIB30_091386 [Stylosanthes scabra]|uniref:RRM domain-containing protein n=1 Tax=Stylosanthes scabra TaxID=79078 RepID=A0ABU6VTA0_9FABA|nr:hypothetical protein [Stylosanthes scabra]
MATTMSSLTTQELHHFHKTDRKLFCFLIFKLRHDITESLLIMALWLWLEHIGYPNLIHAIMKLQNQPYLVEAMVDEAVACLMCLETENSNRRVLVLMKKLIERDISIRIFQERRVIVMMSPKNTPNNNLSTFPGLRHPFFGDIIDMMTKAPQEVATEASSNHGLLHQKIWDGKKPSDDVPKEDRTMFLTFSRGYPVTEKEVRELFGDECVESVNMGSGGNDGRQKLYAVMVLKEVATIDRILKGKRMAKLHINGKHIWTRKYEYHSYP